MKNEEMILDKGYKAVRQMAHEMLTNGATPADILFHANQIWHEFKSAAFVATKDGAVGQIYVDTGAYIDEYNHEATQKIILADERYTTLPKVLRKSFAPDLK